jgi:hypothetical protein
MNSSVRCGGFEGKLMFVVHLEAGAFEWAVSAYEQGRAMWTSFQDSLLSTISSERRTTNYKLSSEQTLTNEPRLFFLPFPSPPSLHLHPLASGELLWSRKNGQLTFENRRN